MIQEFHDTASTTRKLLQDYAMEKFKKANTYDDEDLEHRSNVHQAYSIIEVSNQLEKVIHSMGNLAFTLTIIVGFLITYGIVVTMLYAKTFWYDGRNRSSLRLHP